LDPALSPLSNPLEIKKLEIKKSAAILDPPREGLAQEFSDIATSVERLGVQELVFVGCDVDSWARDLSKWLRRGWILKRMMLVDLFPQTAHVESVALLLR
jgi:23S rRNA (uracil1939-C5)-methyltransferase